MLLTACNGAKQRQLEVTATAYNSLRGQTQGNPAVTAWGDTLKPGMKAIRIVSWTGPGLPPTLIIV